MDLPRGLSAWLDYLRRVLDEAAGQDPSSWDGLHLTFSIDVGRSAKAGELPRPPAAGEEHPESGDHAGTEPSQPPQARVEDQPPAVSLHRPEHQEILARSEPDREVPAAIFWDVLDPIEREGLRAMASLRTFAAGATIMREGDRADYVMVILGGQVKICTDENGTERVLAVRGLGQLVGERGALEVSVRSATVIALDMVWALVVQTKDFAAFLSTHPRVLAIVQNQADQRRAQGSTGTGPAAAGKTWRSLAADYPRQGSHALNGENCTVCLTDVVGFGARSRTDTDRRLIRAELFAMTQAALEDIADVLPEDRGDGFLTVVPPSVSTAKVMDQLLPKLLVALELHNSTARASARFQLRLAVNVGPVVSDAAGVTGEAIIVAARLVEAPLFKRAIEGSSASLGVIASPFVYETVIRHGRNPDYTPVPVEVKESNTTAWMKLFGTLISSPLAPSPATPESFFGPLTR
jgi:hypothetical protein